MTGSIIISVTYGIDTKSEGDPYIEIAEKALDVFMNALNPSTFVVVSYLPQLHSDDANWFPGAAFKRKAKEWRKLYENMATIPFEVTKNGMRLFEDGESVGYTEDTVRETAASMYEDTVFTGLLSFILAMVCFPEYQVKAQEELDKVIGPGRLPDFTDKNSLPYCTAIMHEVMRWQTIGPVGVIHFIHVEDEYRGYRIPKDSTVIPNAWAILHDEEMYPDPYRFNPDRWIKDGKINPDVRDTTAGFGFGRRICPGRFLAQSVMFLTIATMLTAFEITKAIDDHGNVIEPTAEYISSLQNRPAPFMCTIKPRSEQLSRLIQEGFEHFGR
ncbi:cytochrome p450 [Moniliophthora roreri]|nr:cytochrome p450 [Moniliophthora roreri]